MVVGTWLLARGSRRYTVSAPALGIVLWLTSGCSSSSATSGSNGTGGSTATGGTQTTLGGKSSQGGTGGIVGTGGTTVAGSGLGGTLATIGGASNAGQTSTGGNVNTGGASAVGGSSSTGGALSSGGNAGAGGSAQTGGTPATGGTHAAGGTSAIGGTHSTGGTSTTGGTSAGTAAATATGGAPATGGTTSFATGGTNPIAGGTSSATGGTNPIAGGTSSATGGTNSSGGTEATGGLPATGGTSAAGCPGAPDSHDLALLHFDNSLVDEVSTNTWSITGATAFTSATAKFGQAMNFPGGALSTNYLSTTNSITFGTGDFTIDFWIYLPVDQSVKTIANNRDTDPNTGIPWSVNFYDGTNTIGFHTAYEILLTANQAIPLDTWTHVAVARSNTSLSIYYNGQQVGTVPNNTNFTAAGGVNIGTDKMSGSNIATDSQFIMDEFRISNVARWTSDFTPPTQECVGSDSGSS